MFYIAQGNLSMCWSSSYIFSSFSWESHPGVRHSQHRNIHSRLQDLHRSLLCCKWTTPFTWLIPASSGFGLDGTYFLDSSDWLCAPQRPCSQSTPCFSLWIVFLKFQLTCGFLQKSEAQGRQGLGLVYYWTLYTRHCRGSRKVGWIEWEFTKIFKDTRMMFFYTWKWCLCHIIGRTYALQRSIYELTILFRFQFSGYGQNKYVYPSVTKANTQILLACGR